MKLPKTLEDISDGKLYDIEDKVKAGTNGCEGCSACCHDVGDLVTLTPFDSYELIKHVNKSFDQLLDEKFELYEQDKIVLPHLKMQGAAKACSFLDVFGRCEVHGHRPNICRLFPLGRIYEKDDFKYFLQVNSCIKPQLQEVQLKVWLGIERYPENKAFLLAWHGLLKALVFRLKFVHDEKTLKEINTYLLDMFYRAAVGEEDFYTFFWKQLPIAKQNLGIL